MIITYEPRRPSPERSFRGHTHSASGPSTKPSPPSTEDLSRLMHFSIRSGWLHLMAPHMNDFDDS